MDQICPMRQSLPANLYKKFAYNYNTHSQNTYTLKKPTKEKRKKKKEKVSKRVYVMGNGEGTTTRSTNYHEQSQRPETIRKIGFKHTSQISINCFNN